MYTGVRSAIHAAETAYDACSMGNTADDLLARYEKRWKADFGKELELGFHLFGIRQTLTGEEIDRLIRVLNEPSLKADILEYGDMDRPGVLLGRIMKNPKILSCFGNTSPIRSTPFYQIIIFFKYEFIRMFCLL